MRKVSALFLSVLAISMFVSLGFVQSAYASPKGKHRLQLFYWKVWMYPSHGGPPGWAESNLAWLAEWNVYPWHWWDDPGRAPFPPEEYTIDDIYVCHGDWKAYSAVYDETFRYRWWIFWESEEAAGEPGAKSLGGYFIFSHGTGELEDMRAFGRAWVEMEPGQVYPVGYQYHVGLMWRGPE